MAVKFNPWLEARQPLRDTSYPERDRDESNLWCCCISVLNNDILKQLGRTLRVFNHQRDLVSCDFSLKFDRQVQANEGCPCGRRHLHTRFHFGVIVNVKRSTAHQMACAAFQQLGIVPSEDHSGSFSHPVSVYKMELLLQSVDRPLATNTVNPWLLMRQPLRDTKYPERDRKEDHSWFGCISVVNSDVLKELWGTARFFNNPTFSNAFRLEFGPQVQANEVCQCERRYLHTHFVLDTIGNVLVQRFTAYQMACEAFLQLGLVPSEDHFKAFSYMASVYNRALLWGML